MAIAHTHSPNIAASAVGIKLRAMDNLGATSFGSQAPIFEELGLVHNFDMGHRIVDTMGVSNLVVLKGMAIWLPEHPSKRPASQPSGLKKLPVFRPGP